MRTELAVGQFADLVNDARRLPTMEEVLEIGATQVGQLHRAPPAGDRRRARPAAANAAVAALGRYGEAVGEAFQLRDDLLGVFGSAVGHRQARAAATCESTRRPASSSPRISSPTRRARAS